MENLRKSRTTTTVVKANVQTNEETQEYVYALDLFLTVQLLDDTLAVDHKVLNDEGESRSNHR